MHTQSLEGGFVSPAQQSAVAFRAIMDAMARPGTLQTASAAQPPGGLSSAAGTVILTLCDPDTPVFLGGALDRSEIRDWISFHTGAPFIGPEHCAFALGAWDDLQPLSRFPIGTPEYPDRSATLIVETAELHPVGARLQGPGIATEAQLSLPDVAPFAANRALFPLGLDFLFTSGTQIAALPRSTQVT